MKKFLLIAAFALLLIPTVANAQLGRGELSLGYGFAPTTDWMKKYTNFLSDVVGKNSHSQSTWGSASIDYSFKLAFGLRVGASLTYSNHTQRANAVAPGGTTFNSATMHYFSVMPFAKMNWLNLRVVKLYSRAGVGWNYVHSKGHGIQRDRNNLAWQVSPLGIEVGGKVAVYAEGGIGTVGSLIAGLRFTF